MNATVRLFAAVSLLVVLGGCAADRPCRHQDLTVAAPVTTSLLYPPCHGRNVRVYARMEPRGSRVDSLRVLVTDRDGAVHPEAPSVRVDAGASPQAITAEGEAGVVYFGYPGPCDGTTLGMVVTVPPSSPCPYRLRIVPHFVAP